MGASTEVICSSVDVRCIRALCDAASFILVVLTLLFVCLKRGSRTRANYLHIQLLSSNMLKYFLRTMMILFLENYMESTFINGWLCHGLNFAAIYIKVSTIAWTTNLFIEMYICLHPHDFEPNKLPYVYCGFGWGTVEKFSTLFLISFYFIFITGAPLIPIVLGIILAESFGNATQCWEGLIGAYSGPLLGIMIGIAISPAIGVYLYLLGLLWGSSFIRFSEKLITTIATLIGPLPTLLEIHIQFAYIEYYPSLGDVHAILTVTQGTLMCICYWILYTPVHRREYWHLLLLERRQREYEEQERNRVTV